MASPKIILIDIDGCLKPPFPCPISLDTLTILRSYNRNKIFPAHISLISGRSQSDLELLLGLIESSIPGVCENGAAVVLPQIEHVILDPLVTPLALANLADLKSICQDSLVDDGVADIKPGREWSITLCPTRARDLEFVESSAKRIIEELGFSLDCLVSGRCVDVVPRGVNKARSVKKLAKRLGVSLAEIAGIGDSRSDISFLREVGFSACPRNADDAVKEVVDFVAKDDFSEGVLEILTNWLPLQQLAPSYQ